jgi:ADP-ribose diphosphatase
MTDEIICGDEWLALIGRQHGQKDVYVIQAKAESLIVPLTTDQDVIFTIEPSPAMNQNVLILPGGEIEDGELHLDGANRELQEEIGYKAQRLDFLTSLQPWCKYLTVTSYVYLARDLTPSTLQGDEDYAIHTKRIPLNQFEQLIASGQLKDSRIISALYLAKRYLHWEAQREVVRS